MSDPGPNRLFGVVGHPVGHVRSPMLFTRYLHEQGGAGTMVAFDLKPGNLRAGLDGLRLMDNLAGFLVTMPHKQSVLPFLDELTPEAQASGAVNIVRRTPEGRLIGGQIDGPGFVAALLAKGWDPAGKRVHLVGAGGVGAGICASLAQAGVAAIALVNRDQARAQALAAHIAARFPATRITLTQAAPGADADLVVNATSLGLRSGDPLPADLSAIAPQCLVADVVMVPRDTPFLLAAQAKGCPVQYGEDMLAGELPLMLGFFSA